MLSFDWSPEPVVVAEDFYKSAAALENLEVPLTMSIPAVIGGIQQVFDEEGPGWAPWSESYAPYAQAHNSGILDQSGALRGGATSEGSFAVVGDVLGFTGGAAPGYWVFHQEGTRRMPARPFVTLTPESELAVLAIFEEWLATVVDISGGAGGRLFFRAPSSGQFVASF